MISHLKGFRIPKTTESTIRTKLASKEIVSMLSPYTCKMPKIEVSSTTTTRAHKVGTGRVEVTSISMLLVTVEANIKYELGHRLWDFTIWV